jgi:hypothetical protein
MTHRPSLGARDRTRPAPSVHVRAFDDELVVLDLAAGEYFALDAIGARLWQGLGAGNTVEDVAKAIVDDYDVSFERALADLLTLADELVARGLVVPARDDRR